MYINGLILILLYLKSILLRSIDLSKEAQFQSHIPSIESSEVEPLSTSAFIVFQTLQWYNHDINYIISLSEIDLDAWLDDPFLFTYPSPRKLDILSHIQQKDSLWKGWTTITTNKRIYQLKSLTPGSYYRVKYQMKSKYSSSQSSIIKYIPLKRENKSISLFARGTGRNHHNNAQVTLNNNIIFNHAKYQGLALIVLSRNNLKVKSIKYYDTYNELKETETKTVTYDKYSYDESNNVITENVSVTITKEYITKQADLLLNALKQLKPSDIFILVSCYGWERYFTVELAEYLTQHGALKIKELNYAFYHPNNENTVDYSSLLQHNYHHHPYALVGIPLIGAGNGYEILQTNKGHYLSTENIPYAEVLVHLDFDETLRVYSFKPTNKEHYNFINHIYLHKALDFSLKNMFPLLVHSNVTTSINSHFNIFEVNTQLDHLMPGYVGCYRTEFDRVVLGNNQCSTRSFFNGVIYQTGLKVEEQWYYAFFSLNGINNKECVPPYNKNGMECLDTALALSSVSLIVQCRIGISPQLCDDNEKYENLFSGYN